MASTFGSLEIAKSGMMAYNAALQTTAHNVANIETKGYSKQTVNMVSLVGNKTSVTVQGFGVNVASITRNRNEYYDTKYQRTQSTYNYYQTQSYYLKALQDQICGNVTSDEKSRLTDAFDDFFSALSNLRGNANNSTIRRQAVTVGETFTDYVQNVATGLQKLQDEANTQVKTCVDQINAYAEKIVALNKQIDTVEAYGGIANDLRDQRSLLIDELSQYCDVETKEIPPDNGVGENQFYVYINGGTLVDTYKVNALVTKQKDTYVNINDITGLYDVSWADGSTFNMHSTAIGGQLQSCIETRDGNNATNLHGAVDSIANNADGKLVLTVTGTNCNDVQVLNIPAHDGEITINNRTYAYDNFEVKVDAAGNFTYDFTLKGTTKAADAKALQIAVANGYTAQVGDSIDNRGVPYYMAQLNEFVRTFAQEFNRVQNGGYDLHDNPGVDFFNATVKATGDNYIFQESVDGKDASFTSEAKKNADGTYTGSYYYMTALNFSITKKVADDPGLLACKAKANPDDNVGNDNGDNLQKLTEIKDNSKMFVHGAPDSFIQSLTALLGVDAKKADTMEKSQSNLLYAIDTNRKSVSGVDEDEEGSDMIVFQNMLFNQYKMLNVLNEVLDKLINETGV